MIRNKLESFMSTRRCTLLGVGPMSKNCVDATIELANEHEAPILMIASRRQIEAASLGGGYVNRWSTEAFAQYVIDRDKKGKIILARDHGGPWQNTFEVEGAYSLRRAMESAKHSYQVDIESGFEFIHIDPSIDINGAPSVDDVLMRVFELYEHCWGIAQKLGKDLIFEIGTEEQSQSSTQSHEELDYLLTQVRRFCDERDFPPPTFIVVQTGTKTLETKNVGSLDTPYRIAGELPSEILIPKTLEVCRKHGIFMKEHNADYLSTETLSWHPKLGIHAANVAPEFGTTETRTLLDLLREADLRKLEDRFIELACQSGKWKKWMLPNSRATDRDRAIISGHYIFADDEVIRLKAQAQEHFGRRGLDLESLLKAQVKRSIERYLTCFQLTARVSP